MLITIPDTGDLGFNETDFLVRLDILEITFLYFMAERGCLKGGFLLTISDSNNFCAKLD